MTHVYDLKSATDAYWRAESNRESQAAYHEMLLFGAHDGYPGAKPWRCAVARWLRIAALMVEGTYK